MSAGLVLGVRAETVGATVVELRLPSLPPALARLFFLSSGRFGPVQPGTLVPFSDRLLSCLLQAQRVRLRPLGLV